jgi:predicted dienelactone hydrolase
MRAVFSLWALLVAWAGFAPPAAAEAEALNIAGLEVAVWLPESAAAGPWPVLIFSHAFHGCNAQATFLMEALAKAGYAVFAPNHRDSTCAVMMWPIQPEAPFREIGEWSDMTFRDRRDDIKRLMNALAADPRYGSLPFDWQHVGLVGHSLGGYTALALAGAWESWRDPRIKAVLALSPFAAPFVESRTLAGLAAPVMFQGGTADTGVTPEIAKPGGAYDASPAPKYFVEFEDAAHDAWTDRNTAMRAPIVEYALAFLDRYLKGKPFPPPLAAPHEGVANVRIEE